MGNKQACCNCDSQNETAEVVQMEGGKQPPPLPNSKSADSGMPHTPRTARTVQEAMETLSETSSTTKKKQHIQAYTRTFVKDMLKGIEVTLVTTAHDNTQEPLRTSAMSSLDQKLTTLHLKSTQEGYVVCPLAKILNVLQIDDGKDNLPSKVVGALSEDELNRMLVVQYEQEDGEKKGFVMLQPDADERKRVYQCLKILHMHAVKSKDAGQDPSSTPLASPRGSPRSASRIEE